MQLQQVFSPSETGSMVVLCGSILQERMSEWVQCPVNVCFAFNSDQIADTARRHIGGH